MRRVTIMAAVLAALVLAAACGGNPSAGSTAPEQGAAAGADANGLLAVAGQPVESGARIKQDATLSLPKTGPRVIKTAELRVEVAHDRVDQAVQKATAAAELAGGYVVSTGVSGKDLTSGMVVVRVPAARFSQVVERMAQLGEVQSRQISGQDVTAEFVDLGARKRNLVAQEQVLLELMGDARTVQDTIRVQHELSGVQGEIEQIEGRLRYLDDQTTMSTISLELREKEAEKPDQPTAIGQSLRDAWGNTLGVVTGVIAAAGLLLPLLLLGALAFLALRPLTGRARKFIESQRV